MKYNCINIQGNLISEEILQKIESAEAAGQQAKDFGFEAKTKLRNEIEYSWTRVKLDWKYFSEKAENLPSSDPYGTTLSRRWMEKFLTSLGFRLVLTRSSLAGSNNQTYNISHVGDGNDQLPIHVVGFLEPNNPEKNTLDIRSSGGTSRMSPHATIQEYLNVSEHLFGLTSNGLSLRLIRDSGRLIKLTYIEFDLKRMLEDDKYSEFTVLYRLLHASRFPTRKSEADQCLLEKYYQESIEVGNRIRDGLSFAVQEALEQLGSGFLRHPQNDRLRLLLASGELSPKDYFRQLLRIVYRLLFLMVTEERDLVYNPEDKSEETARFKEIYVKYYSILRLRKLSENRYLHENRFNDLWQGLVSTFGLFEAGSNGKKLGIDPLAGELFSSNAIANLENLQITNKVLLQAINKLNEFREKKTQILVQVNYRSLDVEELGSVYEGLLELHPIIENLGATNTEDMVFTFHEGTDRKTTGSYYTRPDLVNELIKSALIPVIEERLKANAGNKEARIKALLSLKVCDAAAGSGHMILAAARTIAWYLAREISGEENPAPSLYRQCLRDAIQHCVYAVDMNPDAVELCKLALWLEGHNSGKPLSFLDHKIRCGNSLVGVADLKVLKEGIPSEAFKDITMDDATVCTELKNTNTKFLKKRQGTLDFEQVHEKGSVQQFAHEYKELDGINQDNVQAVEQARRQFEKIRKNLGWYNDWTACNLWTAAFFYTYTEESKNAAPTSERLLKFMSNPAAAYAPMVGKANALSIEHRFFHWPLEFPDVFEQGGFDVMLGNPPWERIKLQQKEFFATRNAVIANAPNAASRNRLIEGLRQTDPDLYKEYVEALHVADATGKFLRKSGRCLFTAVGDINTYPVFSELFSTLINPKGRAGIIVPTGIATDDGNKAFFGYLIENNRLASLFDFENRERIFTEVDSRYKFCLLTMVSQGIGLKKARFGFFLTRVEHLQDELRIFSLTKDDFLRLNPNTKTCPVFRTSIDARLTAKIYKNVPVLVDEETGENPWEISFMRMLDMANDSHLFRTQPQLKEEGFSLRGNKMKRGEEVWLPLYEAKMIWHYDHRFGSYAGVDSRTSTHTPTPTTEKYQDPNYLIMPWYWVEERIVEEITKKKWHIGFRNVTNTTNERTGVFSVVPKSGVGNSLPIVSINTQAILSCCFYSSLSSFIFDYIARQKIAGVNFNFFYFEQIPVLAPNQYKHEAKKNIILNSLELIFSSWDIKSFADDIWKEADEALREAIQQQWNNNQAATGGHTWSPPEWCEIDTEGCPLAPFKWDEDRRAILKAELDAIYAKLYGLTTEELCYILDPQDVYGPDFPGETFRVLKEKEIRKYGEYRTKRLVMEAWDRMGYDH